MSNSEEVLVTVALNCSVKISGTLYAPNDVVRVPEDIARRLIEQKAADAYSLEQEQPLPEQAESGDPTLDEGVEAEGSVPEDEGETVTPAPKAKDSKGKSGKPATDQAAA